MRSNRAREVFEVEWYVGAEDEPHDEGVVIRVKRENVRNTRSIFLERARAIRVARQILARYDQ